MRSYKEVFLYCSLNAVAVGLVMNKNPLKVSAVFLLGHLAAVSALHTDR